MFHLRLQVVIYPEREWSNWESRPQQRCLLYCELNTYRLQSCAFVDNPLHESPRHFNQNFNSEFFNRFVSLPLSELPGMSSSVKNEGPDTRLSRKDAIGSVVFRGPRCLVFVQLNPDHPGSPPFWNKVYKPQENVYDAHGPIFPASRGLSQRGKMKREERDLCRFDEAADQISGRNLPVFKTGFV